QPTLSSRPARNDFLAIIGNGPSREIANDLLRCAARDVPRLPVVSVCAPPRRTLIREFYHRSDHGAFWEAGIPALLWCDTADLRNPHYHRSTDTPDTLDYEFLSAVTDLLTAWILTSCGVSATPDKSTPSPDAPRRQASDTK